MLSELPIVNGPREQRLPMRYQQSPAPDPEPDPNPEQPDIELEIDNEVLQDKAAGFAKVAYAFAASIGSDGSHDPKTYAEAMQ